MIIISCRMLGWGILYCSVKNFASLHLKRVRLSVCVDLPNYPSLSKQLLGDKTK